MNRLPRTGTFISTIVAACCLCTIAPPAASAGIDDGHVPQFLRVLDKPDELISLEIASIDMILADDQTGPRIGLIGVAHIGEASFYAEVQALLDQYEIVLFEAVQPTRARREFSDSHEGRVEATRHRTHFVASVAESYKARHGRYAENLQELRDFAVSIEPILLNWLNRELIDAWGEPITYSVDEDGSSFSLRSSGGGHDAINFEGHDEIVLLDFEADNLQQQLADALSLKFQLRALTYDAPNWRPSDMTMTELNAAFAEEDVDFALVGETLGGTSFPSRLVGGLLRIIGLLDAMSDGAVSDMMKVMLIELLGNETMLEMSMSQLGEGFSKVIVDQRNQVVIDDLAAIIGDEPEIGSIAVLYGAAHMPDLVERLEQQLGYETAESAWLQAITVNIGESQMDARQIQRMRVMVQRMLQQQMRAVPPQQRQ